VPPVRLLLLLVLLSALPPLVAARLPLEGVDEWSGQFDNHFRKYAKRYFGPHFDWRWFKSQGIAESGLDPDASSPAGALGVMQIMPATYAEIRAQNPHFPETDEPRWNIAAGIYYDRVLYDKWHTPTAGDERLLFAFGSYNAGYGRIYKALRQVAGTTRTWEAVAHHVPPPTKHYVNQIQELMTSVKQ
jgi:soluble lytic murein transglycosylase-like protein